VTVQSLSPPKRVASSPAPKGTALRQGLPQKPYTFLEEKARQAGQGRAAGEWMGYEEPGDSWLGLQEEGLIHGSSLLSSSMPGTILSLLVKLLLKLYPPKRETLPYYHHPFQRWEMGFD
jgi:hypothetical protein